MSFQLIEKDVIGHNFMVKKLFVVKIWSCCALLLF